VWQCKNQKKNSIITGLVRALVEGLWWQT